MVEESEAHERCLILYFGLSNPLLKNNKIKVIWKPAIKIDYNPNIAPELLGVVREGDAVAFTSPRAVKALYWSAKINNIYNKIKYILYNNTVGAVGRATADLVSRLFGVKRERVILPSRFVGRELGRVLSDYEVRRVVGCRASIADPGLREVLVSRGVEYVHLIAYNININDNIFKNIVFMGRLSGIKIFVILSSRLLSEHFLQSYGAKTIVRNGILVVPIGPTTASVVREAGIEPACVPSEYTLRGALSCIKSLCIDESQGILT